VYIFSTAYDKNARPCDSKINVGLNSDHWARHQVYLHFLMKFNGSRQLMFTM
jgi:hypothetical protein